MNEHYLHVIWNLKRLPFHLLKTTAGQTIEILEVGTWNQHSGPDFFAGKIRIDGIELFGNIEMHVNASDWMKHGHQFDSAYNNVILHVVYEADMDIAVNGHVLPVISLKEHIDWKHFQSLQQLQANAFTLPCSAQLNDVPEVLIWDEITKNALVRVETKAHMFDNTYRITDFKEQLFRFFALSFGMKVNNMAFEEMATRIPIKPFLKAKANQKMAICFGISGLMQKYPQYQKAFESEWDFQKKRLNLVEMQVSSWKTKGHRPQGFPDKRLFQFTHLIDSMDWSSDFWQNDPKAINLKLQSILMKSILVNGIEVSGMSMNTANVIICNSVVPFLLWLSDWKKDSIYVEKAMAILEILPAEKNEIITKWNRFHIQASNALESQGMIQLYNEKCKKKACLNCKIGRFCMQ